jgi:hypothetical protein
MTPRSKITPGPDHAAEPVRFWESAPFRTIVTGVSIDILIALCLLVVMAMSNETVDWLWLLAALGKTFLMTLASGILKRVKPRQLTDRAAS